MALTEDAVEEVDPAAYAKRMAEAGFDIPTVWRMMRQITPPLPPAEAVTVAYVVSNKVSTSFMHSLGNMQEWDRANDSRLVAGGTVAIRYGTDGLPSARNMAVKIFLEERPADWLLWLDTDMGFMPDTVDRLLSAADPEKRPIVGALCFSMQELAEDMMGGWVTRPVPTIYEWRHEGDLSDPAHPQGFAPRVDYPDNTLVRCAGTGAACVLIHRSVFERMRDDPMVDLETGKSIRPAYGRGWAGWYDRVTNLSMRKVTGEDLSFCMRAWAMGLPTHILTSVRTTHEKTVWLSDDQYWQHRAMAPRVEGDLPWPAMGTGS